MTTYDNWEEACEQSMKRLAVADIMIEHKGKRLRAEIVVHKTGKKQICWRHTLMPIRNAETREVDSIRRWKAF